MHIPILLNYLQSKHHQISLSAREGEIKFICLIYVFRTNFIYFFSSLSLIGMPYYKEPLLSVWPSNMKFEVGKPPPKIDPDILNNMKMIDFVGYSPNPGNMKRNQVVRYSRKKHKDGTPKFRSEKERELQSGKSSRVNYLFLSVY